MKDKLASKLRVNIKWLSLMCLIQYCKQSTADLRSLSWRPNALEVFMTTGRLFHEAWARMFHVLKLHIPFYIFLNSTGTFPLQTVLIPSIANLYLNDNNFSGTIPFHSVSPKMVVRWYLLLICCSCPYLGLWSSRNVPAKFKFTSLLICDRRCVSRITILWDLCP